MRGNLKGQVAKEQAIEGVNAQALGRKGLRQHGESGSGNKRN